MTYAAAIADPVRSWSPIRDPYRDPQASAALFLSWLPALLCGVRVAPLDTLYQWAQHGQWVRVAMPTPATCSCSTWGWGGALCDVHGGGK